MKHKNVCGIPLCNNAPSTKGRNYCDLHRCRINTCKKSILQCFQHYCKFKIGDQLVHCNAPIRQSGEFCSKHACPTCKRTRYECTDHFCNRLDCAGKKMDASPFCEVHTCPVCHGISPCTAHSCHYHGCKMVVSKNFDFCDEHSLESELFYEKLDISEYNCVLNDFYELDEEFDHPFDIVNSFEELKKRVVRLRFRVAFQRVAKKYNAQITVRDSSLNDLICFNYCSYGYCSCDCMPRINNFMTGEETRSEYDEEVTVLSDKASTHSDWVPNKKAWTLPRALIEDPDILWDGTDNQIEKLIRFERVY